MTIIIFIILNMSNSSSYSFKFYPLNQIYGYFSILIIFFKKIVNYYISNIHYSKNNNIYNTNNNIFNINNNIKLARLKFN
jgi:hypothetical protein